jgi:hypothetical protein
MRLAAEIMSGIIIAVLFYEIGHKKAATITFLYLDAILKGEGLNTLEMLEKYKNKVLHYAFRTTP